MDSRDYRHLIGRFATGVTVVTTAADGLLHGMTANAVCSVSLEPILLLVCVEKTAHCHAHLRRAGAFAVNVLAADQEEISNRFARTQEPSAAAFEGIPHRFGPSGVPVLDDALAWLACELYQQHPGGDHDIFLGRVVAGLLQRETEPLLFYGGRYRGLTPFVS